MWGRHTFVAGLRTSLVKTGVVQARRAAVVTVLLLAMVAAPAWGAPSQAGSKCKKVGATMIAGGKKFTCIKSAGKLIYNKGVAVSTTTKPSAGVVKWSYNGSAWTPTGTPAPCPQPLIAQGALLDFSKAVSKVQPGQSRGGSYKPHGGLRWSEYGKYVSGVTITAPFDGEIHAVAQYIESGNYQFTVNIIHPCGIMLRLGHLRVPSDVMKNVLNTAPAARESDSRETFLTGSSIKKGQIIATEVGMIAPAGPDSFGTFMDLGIVDLRAKNASLPAGFTSNADARYSTYSVCWYVGNYFSEVDRTTAQRLPDSNGDATSDYCKS